jgi:hypothetical protein
VKDWQPTLLTQVRGMNVALVCERCTTKDRWKETLKYTAFTLGLGIAGLILTAIGCTPGILLALAGLLTPLAFLAGATRNRQVLAEEIAIAIRKPHLEQDDINAFWTTQDIEDNFHIPRPATSARRPAPVRGRNLLWPAAILGIGVALLLVSVIIVFTVPDLDPDAVTQISDSNLAIFGITCFAGVPISIVGLIWLVVLMIRMRKAKAS